MNHVVRAEEDQAGALKRSEFAAFTRNLPSRMSLDSGVVLNLQAA